MNFISRGQTLGVPQIALIFLRSSVQYPFRHKEEFESMIAISLIFFLAVFFSRLALSQEIVLPSLGTAKKDF